MEEDVDAARPSSDCPRPSDSRITVRRTSHSRRQRQSVSPTDDRKWTRLALISLPRDNKSGGQRGVTLSGSALMENSGAGDGDYCVRRRSTIRSRGSGAFTLPLSYENLFRVLCVRVSQRADDSLPRDAAGRQRYTATEIRSLLPTNIALNTYVSTSRST